jgi:8-oxo-dGTP pyrophosphatase MutT (NUDIX family)
VQPVDWAGLSEEEIMRRLEKSQPVGATVTVIDYRPAAVLVPFLRDAGSWSLLFTRRTEIVQSHKGQVSFPGGAAEAGDSSPEATALREAEEEIGLHPRDVKILGRLAPLPTISRFVITPVLGCIPWPYEFTLSTSEVSRVFTIPLAWLADPGNWEIRPRVLPSGVTEDIIYYRLYAEELLWGISARITRELLETLS